MKLANTGPSAQYLSEEDSLVGAVLPESIVAYDFSSKSKPSRQLGKLYCQPGRGVRAAIISLFELIPLTIAQ